ncbi:hypothetical protein A2U01_0101218, partial [Trifolium medium]|nr:hypothetical protein [Trifolium medium]
APPSFEVTSHRGDLDSGNRNNGGGF